MAGKTINPNRRGGTTVNQTAIASELNLSVGTVSKALRNFSEISPHTRARVVKTAKTLGYRPANSLAGGNTVGEGFVGVLVNSHPLRGSRTGYLEGMSQGCARLNVSLVVHFTRENECERILEPEHQQPAMRDGRLAGLILIHRWPENVVRALSEQMFCVSIIHQVLESQADMIGPDHNSAMAMLMDKLYRLGHRKIGFLGRCGSLSWSRARAGGYTDSLCRLELQSNAEWMLDVPSQSMEYGSYCWDEHIDRVAQQIRRGVRAWVCASDSAGYELCRGLMNRGFSVPRDVSITGFDSNSETPTYGCPTLTSVLIPARQMGEAALKLLISRLGQPDQPRHNLKFDCQFVQGQTIAPPER